MTKIALVTGITGQDGSYIAQHLLQNNYRVIGLHRRSSTNTFERIKDIEDKNFTLQEFDLTDPSGCHRIIDHYQPNEIYNLAAQSHVATSFNQPGTTFDINTTGVINLLEAIRNRSPSSKFYQASTSEMFGSNFTIKNGIKYQDENTPFLPQSPYAVAKLASHRLVQIYRDAYGLYACSGILFNHESPRRGENFVTRKITSFLGQLINNKIPSNSKLRLGNLEAQRDWGHAKDYVVAMRLMLQQNNADDFVISTGQSHTVQEFLSLAFDSVNLIWTDYVVIDRDLYRPCEVPFLQGDYSKAKSVLGWSPQISFDDLVTEMVSGDINRHKNAS